MGKMKDEWFEEFYGEIDAPRWHTEYADTQDRDSDRNGEITFRSWDEANVSDLVEGWDPRDFDTHPSSKVEDPNFAFLLDVYDTQDELADILIAKHSDYGPKNIANAPGGALNGLSVRLYDKLARLENLLKTNKDPKNESLRDTFVDIANYGTIGLMVIDGKWDKG